MPELDRLLTYWQRCPPLHLLARAALGYEPGAKAALATEEECRALARLAEGGR